MMTTSANIAGTPQPFAVTGHGTRPWPYGSAKIYRVDDLKPRKKKKSVKRPGGIGMLYVGTIGEAYTEPVGNPKDGFWKIPSLGKIGVWRTIRGKRYFFPVDGSSSIPKVPGGGEKGSGPKIKVGKKWTAPKKKKKGILGAIMDKIKGALGGAGGAKAKVKPVKPKGGKKGAGGASGGDKPKNKGNAKIPGGDKMLTDVEEMMLKASRSKGGRKVGSALKKMQSALKSDDPKAFKKAEQSLAMATAKLAKKRGG